MVKIMIEMPNYMWIFTGISAISVIVYVLFLIIWTIIRR
jgi:hypothetical protein